MGSTIVSGSLGGAGRAAGGDGGGGLGLMVCDDGGGFGLGGTWWGRGLKATRCCVQRGVVW